MQINMQPRAICDRMAELGFADIAAKSPASISATGTHPWPQQV
jgi:hypothetical protein